VKPRPRGAGSVLVWVVALAMALSGGAASADPPSPPAFRWSRPLGVREGWARAVLPDDVLAESRPGLPDVRVRGKDDAEVPYVLEQALGGVPEEWITRDVESSPERETTAIVDRGAHPTLADEATIEVDAADFLKPIVVLASEDGRDWKEIARGSIFATTGRAGARMTTVRFAPSDRRYWQLRLDDRNGPPVVPRGVLTGSIASDGPAPREIALDVKRIPGEGDGSTYEVTLPSANLAVASLRLAPEGATFERRVTVTERVFARDEIIRREVGGGTARRSPGGESLSIPLGDLRGPTLELRVEDGSSPPLALSRATAILEPRSILFHASAGSLPLALDYGSGAAEPPRYDLAAALARGRPEHDRIALAELGAPSDRGATSPVGVPPHGGAIDEALWQTKAAVDLPGGGGVTYLALDGIAPSAGLRVVDGASREVPYLFERAVHHAREAARWVSRQSPGRTTLAIAELASVAEISSVELTAAAPDYFVRQVTIVEAVRDARGPVGERVLGSATWVRRPGEAALPERIAVLAPTQAAIEVRIDDGGNAPLTLTGVTVERGVRRIDFVCAKGESLSLLAGNPAAGAPTYDLSLLAGALLAAPAQAARLEPARDLTPAHAPPAKWFWAAVIVAGLGVAAALARALRTPGRA
jgi:hypothetical protein